jgi:hypothetical protein
MIYYDHKKDYYLWVVGCCFLVVALFYNFLQKSMTMSEESNGTIPVPLDEDYPNCATTESPPVKRMKTVQEEEKKKSINLHDLISSQLLDNVQDVSESYQANKPYPHGLVEDVFIDGFLGTE